MSSLQGLGVASNAIGSLLNTVQDIWSSAEHNRRIEQGLQGLQNLAPQATGAITNLAAWNNDAVRRQQEAGYNQQARGISGFASSYFGAPTANYAQPANVPSPLAAELYANGNAVPEGANAGNLFGAEAGYSSGNTEADAAVLRQQLGQIDIRNAQPVQAIQQAAADSLAGAKADEAARLGELSTRFNRTETAINREYGAITDTAQSTYNRNVTDIRTNLAQLDKLVRQGIDFTKTNLTETLSSIKDNAARMIADVGVTAMAAGVNALKVMKGGLTGNAQQDQLLRRDMATVAQKTQQQGTEQLIRTRADMNNYMTSARLTATGQAEANVSKLTDTLRAGQSEAGANIAAETTTRNNLLKDAYNSFVTGKVDLQTAFANASNASAQFIEGIRQTGLQQYGSAILQAGEVLQQTWAAANQLASDNMIGNINRQNQFATAIGTGLTMGVNLESNANQFMINTQADLVNFAQFGETTYGMWAQNQQLENEHIQASAASKQADWAWAGPLATVLSA